ncbi:DUF975 family protein [Latilactobacillus sakei]
MKFCPNCGSEIKEGAKFCPKCGFNIEQMTNPNATSDSVKSRFEKLKTDEEMALQLDQVEGLNMTRADIKKEAQRKLSGRYGEWMKTILWLVVGMIVVTFLLVMSFGRMMTAIEMTILGNLYSDQGPTGFTVFLWFVVVIMLLIVLFLIACLRKPVLQWCAIVTLRGQRADGLKIFNYLVKAQKNRVLKANVLTTFYQFSWSLLFVIPGVVKGASYAMTNVLLEKNPEMTASEAINMSRKIMHGYKLEFLIMQYSFYFWQLLVGVTYGLANFYVLPYQNVTEIQFLESLYQRYQENETK